jgi:hydroxyacid-oxoacid transhydrogenase
MHRPHDDSWYADPISLAASTAGIGFGNAGVHIPVSDATDRSNLYPCRCEPWLTLSQHAFSYPISSLNKGRPKERQYHHPSYAPDVPLIPHGVAVSLTAPAVFNFTAPSSPQRHREAAAIFMGDRAGELARVRDEDLGRVLQEEIRRFLDILGVPRGLSEVGYKNEDIATVSMSTGESESSMAIKEGMPPCQASADPAFSSSRVACHRGESSTSRRSSQRTTRRRSASSLPTSWRDP